MLRAFFVYIRRALTRFLSYSSRATGRRLYTTDSSEFPPKWAEPLMRPEHVNNMPAPSFGETETDGGMTDRRPGEPESRATSRNVVSLVSRLADDHLTLVRVGEFSRPLVAGRLAAKMVAAVTLLRGFSRDHT